MKQNYSATPSTLSFDLILFGGSGALAWRKRPALFRGWRRVERICAAWPMDPTGPRPYAAGSWGPPAASALVACDGLVRDEVQ